MAANHENRLKALTQVPPPRRHVCRRGFSALWKTWHAFGAHSARFGAPSRLLGYLRMATECAPYARHMRATCAPSFPQRLLPLNSRRNEPFTGFRRVLSTIKVDT